MGEQRKVIGAGLVFLGSGCGSALTRQQRDFLAAAKPEELYPLEKLLDMLATAEAENPDLIYSTGRRWGSAVHSEMVSRGAKSVKEALELVAAVYLEHHQGDVGKLVLEDAGDRSVLLRNLGPYPSALIAGAYEALALAMGADDVSVEPQAEPNCHRISWQEGDSD